MYDLIVNDNAFQLFNQRINNGCISILNTLYTWTCYAFKKRLKVFKPASDYTVSQKTGSL